jgi:DNA-binding CsgD family transcriptional regulator
MTSDFRYHERPLRSVSAGEPVIDGVEGLPCDQIGNRSRRVLRLVDGSEGPDQLLLDVFLRARDRTRGPLVAVSERTVITNTSASELLQPADRRSLWERARQAMDQGVDEILALVLTNGVEVTVRCQPVGDRDHRAGAVLQLTVSDTPRAQPAHCDPLAESGQPPLPIRVDPSLLGGWVQLTDVERVVAELVARGLTNKETARQIFVSRHTVDSHLRRVFQKLGVTSRVELARLVGEHYESLRGSSTATLPHAG